MTERVSDGVGSAVRPSALPVLLSGRRGGTTHREVELLASLPPELRLIGRLAVMCRVGSPHRATIDLDAVTRDLTTVHSRLAHLALTASGGGQYRFAGDLDLDVIDVAPVAEGRYAHFVDRAYRMNDQDWGVFSLDRLARTPEFRQAAA